MINSLPTLIMRTDKPQRPGMMIRVTLSYRELVVDAIFVLVAMALIAFLIFGAMTACHIYRRNKAIKRKHQTASV
jgi:heme/copper-type cytochrome/quinol oxidase subunit 2